MSFTDNREVLHVAVNGAEWSSEWRIAVHFVVLVEKRVLLERGENPSMVTVASPKD